MSGASSSVRLGASPLQFSATIVDGTASSYTWAVNGSAGGSSTLGTIDATGKYTPPAVGATVLQDPATVSITASAAGVTSAPVSLSLLNPVPAVTAASVSGGGTLFTNTATTIQVSGTSFVAGAQILVDGTAVTTTVTSSTQLTATITAAAAGDLSITVRNPNPGSATADMPASLTALNRTFTPFLVKDINPSGASDPLYLTDVNGTLFFRATDGAHGTELWRSDGTEAGTVMVTDGTPGAADSSIYELININGTLFFEQNNYLWKSNGSLLDTIQLTTTAWPANMINVNGTAFFMGDENATTGGELWKSDGTPSGTRIVKDIRASGSSNPYGLTNVNGTVFFAASEDTYGTELWKSDGTEIGTVLVKDILPAGSSIPVELTNVNGTLFFAADDGVHNKELWKSDGTEIGTVLVKDIRQGQSPFGQPMSSGAAAFFNGNGTLYFQANDGSHGTELWKSDGTEAGTVMVADLVSGSSSSNPYPKLMVNGKLLFQTYPDPLQNPGPWYLTDGTEAGTTQLSNSSDWAVIPADSSSFYYFIRTSAQLWKTDGTGAGVKLADLLGSPITQLTVSGHYLFFVTNDGTHGNELWALQVTP